MSANFAEFIDGNALRWPDAIAVVSDTNRVTYTELSARTNAFASWLHEVGIGADDRVAVLARNSPDFLVVTFAIWKVGAISVPLNVRLQSEELGYLLDHSGAKVIVTEEDFISTLESLPSVAENMRERVTMSQRTNPGWQRLSDIVQSRLGQMAVCTPRRSDDLQRIMYTSGTTSRPKGVMYTHGMIAHNVLAQTRELALTRDDRVLVSSPLFHVAAFDAPGIAVLFHGGTMIMMPKFDAQRALELMQEEQTTGAIMAQTMLHLLRDVPDRGMSTSSMRWLIFGAAPGELYADIERFFPETHLIQAYGLTEGTSAVTYMDQAHSKKKFGTTGSVVSFVDVAIVGDDDQILPTGETGEIVIRGPKVTPGYWRDATATNDAWRGGWFHTGDVGHLDADGYLALTDRKKDMIRTGGENVASMEIERVLYSHGGVSEAAVIGAADAKWGEVPVAFVVAAEGHILDADELIDFCSQSLARFKVPSRIEFLDELPRNVSGKVLKTDLRRRASSERC